jgi:hypothetical protein
MESFLNITLNGSPSGVLALLSLDVAATNDLAMNKMTQPKCGCSSFCHT